jgi:hypothetical protein
MGGNAFIGLTKRDLGGIRINIWQIYTGLLRTQSDGVDTTAETLADLRRRERDAMKIAARSPNA